MLTQSTQGDKELTRCFGPNMSFYWVLSHVISLHKLVLFLFTFFASDIQYIFTSLLHQIVINHTKLIVFLLLYNEPFVSTLYLCIYFVSVDVL